MLTVDANVILRLILNDNEEMVKEIYAKLQEDTFLVKREIIAEIIYVLTGVYKIDREKAGNVIFKVLETEGMFVESEDAVRYAITVYQARALDFIDCMLYAYQKTENEKIFTFDKKLQKLLKIESAP